MFEWTLIISKNRHLFKTTLESYKEKGYVLKKIFFRRMNLDEHDRIRQYKAVFLIWKVDRKQYDKYIFGCFFYRKGEVR